MTSVGRRFFGQELWSHACFCFSVLVMWDATWRYTQGTTVFKTPRYILLNVWVSLWVCVNFWVCVFRIVHRPIVRGGLYSKVAHLTRQKRLVGVLASDIKRVQGRSRVCMFYEKHALWRTQFTKNLLMSTNIYLSPKTNFSVYSNKLVFVRFLR